MKKRLLITSIVMMLVVAVALSTATYAWFTSATEVTASTISLTAGTSQSTALGIQWSAGTSGTDFNAHYGTSVTAIAPSTAQAGGFQPAAPAALDIATAPSFNTAFIDAQGKFKADGTATDVYRFNGLDTTNSNAASTTIHIANLAQSGAVNVYLTAAITVPEGENITDGTALVRIAVYEVNNTIYTYKGLLGSVAGTNNTAVGTIAATNAASALLTGTTTTELNLGSLAAQTDKGYAIYVWLDGAAFDEAQSGKQASVALKFATTGTATEINA